MNDDRAWLWRKLAPYQYNHVHDPRLYLHRIQHYFFGPIRGCSCSRCFSHRWRITPATEIQRDRIRLAELDAKVWDLSKRVKALEGK